MADKKISDLGALATADATDVVPLVDVSAGVTKKVTVAGLAAAIASNIPEGGIEASDLATSAILLGFAERTSGFTTNSATPVQVTGLSVTATVPPGGRKVKLTVTGRDLYNGSNSSAFMRIWDGAVGSGTQKQETLAATTSSGATVPAFCQVIYPASAGSHTWNVSLHSAAGTSGLDAAATYPLQLIVELV